MVHHMLKIVTYFMYIQNYTRKPTIQNWHYKPQNGHKGSNIQKHKGSSSLIQHKAN